LTKGAKIVQSLQAGYLSGHRLYHQRFAMMVGEVSGQWVRISGDPIPVAARQRGKPGIKTRWCKPGLQDADGTVFASQGSVEFCHQGVFWWPWWVVAGQSLPQLGGNVEVDHLSSCVHAGIGPSRDCRFDRLAEDLPQAHFDRFLHGW